MNGGIIEQVGPPQELYHHPRTRFVAGFIGSPAMNFFPVQVLDGAVRLEDGQVLPIPPARRDRYAPFRDTPMLLGLRPEHLPEQGAPPPRPGSAPFTIRVDVVEPMGMETMVHFRMAEAEGLAGTIFTARVAPETPARPGEPVILQADMNQMHLLDPNSGKVV
jgi:multiple sugar transport system ATP-binding protein